MEPLSRNEPSLSTLSNELILMIAEYLTGPELASLKNLSFVNRHFRELTRALIFKSIVLAKSPDPLSDRFFRWQPKIRVWTQMCDGIRSLSANPHLRGNIIKLRLEIPMYIAEAQAKNQTGPKDDIVKSLKGLVNLEHLQARIPYDCDPYSSNDGRKYLDARGSTENSESQNIPRLSYLPLYALIMKDLVSPLLFTNVNTLVIDQTMLFLLKHCPRVQHLGLINTKRLEGIMHKSLRYYAKFATSVVHLEARVAWSQRDELLCVAEAWPNLRHLGVISPPGETHLMPKIHELLRKLGRSLECLEVLKLAEFDTESFSAGPLIRFSNLFRNTANIHASWVQPSKELDLPWETFIQEHEGHQIMNNMMDAVFRDLGRLEECRIGDVAGARRVRDKETSDGSGELLGFRSDGRNDFKWLEHAELQRPSGGNYGGDWLFGPVLRSSIAASYVQDHNNPRRA